MSLTFRITGPQSIDRLTPLLSDVSMAVTWDEVTSPNRHIDLVWETACEKLWTNSHKSAAILNRLSNTQIIEDKANLAFLQLRMDVPTLKTYLACSAVDVLNWASQRWIGSDISVTSAADVDTVFRNLHGDVSDCKMAEIDDDWWAVKAARGNGGKDVWIMNNKNFHEIYSQLPCNDEFVIQKYVEHPMLWNGKKKFHFRCYSTLHGDMRAMVYNSAYVLTASADFDKHGTESMKHITNLSVNKATPNHPGQIPCNLAIEFPAVSLLFASFVFF